MAPTTTVLNEKVPRASRDVAIISIVLFLLTEGGLALVLVMNNRALKVSSSTVAQWVGLAALALLYLTVTGFGFVGSQFRNKSMLKVFVACSCFNALLAIILMAVYFSPSTALSKRLGLSNRDTWDAINKLFLVTCLLTIPMFLLGAWKGYNLIQLKSFVRTAGSAPLAQQA